MGLFWLCGKKRMHAADTRVVIGGSRGELRHDTYVKSDFNSAKEYYMCGKIPIYVKINLYTWTATYLYVKRELYVWKETRKCCRHKGGVGAGKGSWGTTHMSNVTYIREKRPIYMAYVCEQRPTHRPGERRRKLRHDTYVQKNSYLAKRALYSAKETYISQRRPIFRKRALCSTKETCIPPRRHKFRKSAIEYSATERNLLKRDLQKRPINMKKDL